MLNSDDIEKIMEMLNIQLERIDDRMTRLAISSTMRGYLNLYK